MRVCVSFFMDDWAPQVQHGEVEVLRLGLLCLPHLVPLHLEVGSDSCICYPCKWWFHKCGLCINSCICSPCKWSVFSNKVLICWKTVFVSFNIPSVYLVLFYAGEGCLWWVEEEQLG